MCKLIEKTRAALRIPFFGRQKLLLSFEYGVQVALVALAHGVELTPEIVKKAETMIENEARTHTTTHMAGNMVPNLLSVFELDISK